jgi:sialic acid synthase SpsE
LVPAYKIESGDITNHPRLEKIAGKGKPIILSIGMSILDEAKEALQVIKNQGNNQIIILHCTSNYPCPLDEVNLRAMQTMNIELNCLVGYSDHTLGITVPTAAVALGAVVIEKHFTLDKNMAGPDHKASLEPSGLRDMVHSIRSVEEQLKKGVKAKGILKKIPNIEKLLGDGIKKPTQSEEEIKKTSRKSIVARVDISKESVITADMLTIKRPGIGIEPKNKNINKLIEKKAKMDIAKDTVLSWDMFR